jgi:hypothetical protein
MRWLLVNRRERKRELGRPRPSVAQALPLSIIVNNTTMQSRPAAKKPAPPLTSFFIKQRVLPASIAGRVTGSRA